MDPLTSAEKRRLRAQAQRLKATVRLGKRGVCPGFLLALDEALESQELVKVRFDDFKDEKKVLAPRLAEETGSHFVTRVGNVAVLYRKRTPQAESESESESEV